MSGFGVGYGDIVTAIRQGKQLYDSFYDEFENSPKQIQELLEITKDVRDTVLRYEEVLSRWGQRLGGIEAIRLKLAEADKIVEKNSELINKPGVSQSGVQYRAKRVWKTARLGFDERISKITDGLQLQLGMLVAKFFAIAAQNSQNQIPGDTYGFQGSPSSNDHQALTDLSQKLMRIRYERQRISGMAARQGIEPSYDSSNQDIVKLFEELCRNAGLHQRDHIPPLLLDQTGPGIVPHNFLHDTFANSQAIHNRNYRPGTYAVPRRPVQTPLAEAGRVFTLPTTPKTQQVSPYPSGSDASTPTTYATTTGATSTVWSSLHTPSTLATTPIPPVPGAPELKPQVPAPWLGEPAIPLHRATFVPEGSSKRVKLDTWRFESTPGRRMLLWSGENPAYSLTHFLPPHSHEVFPYTKHSALKEKPHRVTFQTKHHITLKEFDRVVLTNKSCAVEYRFEQPEYLPQFESDLRDKELLGTFEAARIKCRNAPHTNEHIKIWRSRDTDQTPSLSFFANYTNEGFVEYPIKWFKSPTVQNASRLEVTLELIKPPPGAAGEGKRKGIFRRKSTASPSANESSSSSYFPDSPVSPSISKRGSTTTMSSTSSMGEEYPAYCSSEIYDKIRQLLITFTSQSDYRGFLEAYRQSQNPSSAASSASRPNSGASVQTTHSRASSIIDPIAELSDPDTTGSLATTRDDIYRIPHLTATGTPAIELFNTTSAAAPPQPSNRRPTGPVQHSPGFRPSFNNHPRLSPPSPSTISPLAQRMHAQDAETSSSSAAAYTELGIHLGAYTIASPPAHRSELRSDADPHELHEDTRTQRFELGGSGSGDMPFEMDAPPPPRSRWDADEEMEETVVLDATGGIAGPEPLSMGAPRRGTGLLPKTGGEERRVSEGRERTVGYRPP